MMFTSAARSAAAEASNAAFPEEGNGVGTETGSVAGGVDVDRGAGVNAGAGETVFFETGAGTVCSERVVVALFSESRLGEPIGPGTTESVEEATGAAAAGACDTSVWLEKATIKAPRMSAAMMLK